MRVEIVEGKVAPDPGEAAMEVRPAMGPAGSVERAPDPLRVRLVVHVPAWTPAFADYAAAMGRLARQAAQQAHAAGAWSLLLPALGVEDDGGPTHTVANAIMRALRQAHGARQAPERVRIVCRDATVAAVFRDALAANAIVRRPWA